MSERATTNIRVATNCWGSRRSVELGAILYIGALTLPIFIGVLLFSMSYGYRDQIRSELNALADSAGYAAGSSIGWPAHLQSGEAKPCFDEDCWHGARAAALELVNLSQIPAGYGQILSFDFSDGNQTEPGKWEHGPVTLHIERGRFNGEEFTSFEGDYAADHPGVPLYAAFNSVRIEIVHSEVPAGLPFIGGKFATERVQRIVTFGKPGPVAIAPFALPICSILDSGGYINTTVNAPRHLKPGCRADRLFTSVNRWDGAALPEFTWQPSMRGSVSSPLRYLPKKRRTIQGFTRQTDWLGFYYVDQEFPTGLSDVRPVAYGDLGDTFGVVGVPGSDLPIDVTLDEEYVIQRIESGNELFAYLGEQFHILESGLTRRDANRVIWDEITNHGYGPDSDHPSFAFSQLNAIQQRRLRVTSPGGIPAGLNWLPTYGVNWGVNPTLDHGACNSQRFGFHPGTTSCAEATEGWGPATPAQTGFLNGSDISTPIWSIKIPLIADASPDALGCTDGPIRSGRWLWANPITRPSDPEINTDHRYEIVGFVTANIFDVDIGSTPRIPDMSCTRLTAPAPAAFTVNGQLTPCNVVRARLDCNINFLTASDNPDPATERARFVVY